MNSRASLACLVCLREGGRGRVPSAVQAGQHGPHPLPRSFINRRAMRVGHWNRRRVVGRENTAGRRDANGAWIEGGAGQSMRPTDCIKLQSVGRIDHSDTRVLVNDALQLNYLEYVPTMFSALDISL
eukprot:Gb_10391 [translate_table: standard]